MNEIKISINRKVSNYKSATAHSRDRWHSLKNEIRNHRKDDKMKEIIYTEIEPQIQLNSFIKSFWHFENNSNQTLEYSILPDGCFDFLVFNKKRTQLTGLWNKRIDISIPKETRIFAIRFKPLAVEYLFENSISEILNSQSQNPKIKFVENIVTDTSEFSEFAKQNSLKIATLLGTKKGIDTRKEKVFELLFNTKGTIKISKLSEKSFWSSRQINRYFNSNFGLSAKQYASILKVFSTYKDLANGKLYPQTEYFDQSHFIKEIKKYTGTNPKELRNNKNDRFLQLSTNQMK